MTRCANNHDRDETCADCEPATRPERDQALALVHQLRERLHPKPSDDDEHQTEEPPTA